MIAEEVLALWSAACADGGFTWYLAKETLLCANGRHCLPETLSCVNVAVPAAELPAMAASLFPSLPSNWTLNKSGFAGSDCSLAFSVDGSPVLEISALYGVENEAHMQKLTESVRKVKHRLSRFQYLHKFFHIFLGGVYTRTLEPCVSKQLRKQESIVFDQLIALAGTSPEDAGYVCDCLTSKTPVLLDKSLFRDPLLLPLRTGDGQLLCPVFSGYGEYLEMLYGDYENGLTDAIGCGLTAKEKEELRRHQEKSFEALRFLQELSREFGLRYYLLAGSVLGAVRHGGFIPWDDDIDVGIRIEELDEFEKIVKEQLPRRLPEGFSLKQSGANNPYPRMFSKICYDGRCCIDLWPLVPTYTDGLRAKFLWYFGKLITKLHYLKIGHPINRFETIVKPAARILSDRQVMAMARHNERKYSKRQTPAYINLYSIYRRPKETIQRQWLDQKATALFNGLEVPVVGDTEAYLTHLYGDYMLFPPPWKRASRHVERF